MDEKRIQEVFSDEAFVNSLFEMENPEDVQAAIKEKGLDFTLDDVQKMREGLLKKVSDDGELSVDDLEDVAGGSVTAAVAVVGAVVGIVGGLVSAGLGVAGIVESVRRNRW